MEQNFDDFPGFIHQPAILDNCYMLTREKNSKHMRVVLNSFTRKRTSSLKKNLLSPNFSEPHVYLSRYIRRVSNRTSDK